MSCKMCEKQKDIKNDPYFIMELETGYVILGWFQREVLRGKLYEKM